MEHHHGVREGFSGNGEIATRRLGEVHRGRHKLHRLVNAERLAVHVQELARDGGEGGHHLTRRESDLAARVQEGVPDRVGLLGGDPRVRRERRRRRLEVDRHLRGDDANPDERERQRVRGLAEQGRLFSGVFGRGAVLVLGDGVLVGRGGRVILREFLLLLSLGRSVGRDRIFVHRLGVRVRRRGVLVQRRRHLSGRVVLREFLLLLSLGRSVGRDRIFVHRLGVRVRRRGVLVQRRRHLIGGLGDALGGFLGLRLEFRDVLADAIDPLTRVVARFEDERDGQRLSHADSSRPALRLA